MQDKPISPNEPELNAPRFTHIDARGDAVMVNVGEKPATLRRATAAGRIRMSEECFLAIERGAVKKGDVLAVAQVAGIMGAKRAGELIPLCHPLSLTHCGVTFELFPNTFEVGACCTAQTSGQTGVEMEALSGVSAALLTIYDMCKAIDRQMVIENIHLVEKSGGMSGDFHFRGGGK